MNVREDYPLRNVLVYVGLNVERPSYGIDYKAAHLEGK